MSIYLTDEEEKAAFPLSWKAKRRLGYKKPPMVRYKVYVNGKYDKTITIKSHSYTYFTGPFEQKYPEYKGSLAGSSFNHITMEIHLVMPAS